MNRSKEGKLLVRAEVSHPEGANENWGPKTTLSGLKKIASLIGPAFRFAPIRVREKRMNTHMTRRSGES
jgi:hypothetical protein